MGRNPQTKEPMQIPESRTVTFKPGQDLKSKIS
jgi:nucleoid DNA-binding protein